MKKIHVILLYLLHKDSIFLDPRNIELGARIVTNLEKLYLSLKKLGLQSADKNEYYKLLSLIHI